MISQSQILAGLNLFQQVCGSEIVVLGTLLMTPLFIKPPSLTAFLIALSPPPFQLMRTSSIQNSNL